MKIFIYRNCMTAIVLLATLSLYALLNPVFVKGAAIRKKRRYGNKAECGCLGRVPVH